MYASPADFDRYKDSFYTGGLQGSALQATLESIQALRDFSLNKDKCRRAALLQYFQQVPPFGERCGTCDVCLQAKKFGSDSHRDLGSLGARVVLQAIADLNQPSQSVVMQALCGGSKPLENYRYDRSVIPATSQQRLAQLKEQLPKKLQSAAYWKELLPLLVQKKYVGEATKKAQVGGYDRSWTVYHLTPQGKQVLRSSSASVVLPVPDYLREVERKEEEKRQRVLAKLQEHGITKESLPPEEVETGDGEVVRSYSKWYNYLDNIKKSGRDERHEQLQQLMARIEEWRSQAAIRLSTAPASIMAEHIMVAVAYITATLPPGRKVDAESLEAAGVRSNGINQLVERLGSWVDEFQPSTPSAANESSPHAAQTMVLDSSSLLNITAWKYAVYKPNKKTGVAVWESSYIRFAERGESPETIAMSPENGRKPIQVKTVIGHLLDAILHGRKVDATRLVQYIQPPSQADWNRLVNAEAASEMDAAGDPDSQPNGDKFSMIAFLRPIVGDELADKHFADRTEEEKELFGYWFDKLKWYLAFRRVGYEPNFSD